MKDLIEDDFMIGLDGRRACPNYGHVFPPAVRT